MGVGTEREMDALVKRGFDFCKTEVLLVQTFCKPGGERQRVAVARALVNNPSIILADEPTGNLDTKTSYEIMELFEEIHKKGNTVIIVTHEEDIARYAHRIIRIRDGQIERDEINTNKLDPSELRKQLV